MKNDSHIIVIGSGLGGLAGACTLAARGHKVTVLEKNPWLGGKAAQLNDSGYRFDMGPTILTVPRVLRKVFEEAGKNLDDYIDNRRLDPQWRCFFDEPSGGVSVLDLNEDVNTMQQTLRAFCNGTGERNANGYGELIEYSRELSRISDDFYFWKPIGGLKDMFDWKNTFNINMLKDVMKMRMGKSVAETIRDFVPDKRVAQMLDHFTQYVGSSPYGSPAILCGIAAMQTDEGVWYPIGGTRAVPEAMVKLGTELGIDFRTDTDVTRIEHDGKRVHSVVTGDGETIHCDAILSNMDSVRTYRELCGFEKFNDDNQYEPACSGVVLYLGLDKQYEHLAHHDFVFSRDPEEEFDYIYNKGEPAPDPTCYLADTVKTEPGVAPDGGSALYVLVHTPYLRPHHDWRRDGELFTGYRDKILEKLERTGMMPDLREHIVVEHALTPQDIHDRYRVLNGAIYGLASHGKYLGAFKPGNRSGKLKGLYLAGGAAHPGPGMPMVMMSGWIAADTLDNDGVSSGAKAPASAV